MQLVQRLIGTGSYRFDLVVPTKEYEAIRAQESKLSSDKKLKEVLLKYLTEHPLFQQEFLNNNVRMAISLEKIDHEKYGAASSIRQLFGLCSVPVRIIIVGDATTSRQLVIYLLVTDDLKAVCKILDSKKV